MLERIRTEYRQPDGSVLYGFAWPTESPVAHLIIMEGMEEKCLRYDHFAKYLNGRGFSVNAIDVYGQGENVNPDLSNRGVWPLDGFSKMLEAINRLVQELKKDGKPVYLFSHSMGSFMLQGYIQRFPGDVNRIVLCGSGSKNGAVGIASLLAKLTTTKGNRNKKSKLLASLMFGGFNKKIVNPRTEYDWLSYDKANVDAYIADPLCGFGANKGFCYEFIMFMKTLWTKKGLKKIPQDMHIFIITGEEDPVTGYSKGTFKLKKMYDDLGIKDVRTKVYKPGRHEILNEAGKTSEEAFKDVADYFLEK